MVCNRYTLCLKDEYKLIAPVPSYGVNFDCTIKRVPVKYETDIQHSIASILQQTATTNHPQRERWFPTEADVGGVLLSWWWWAVLYYESPPHTPHCIVHYKRWAIKQHYQTSGSLSSTYIPHAPLTATFQQEEEPCCPNAPDKNNRGLRYSMDGYCSR